MHQSTRQIITKTSFKLYFFYIWSSTLNGPQPCLSHQSLYITLFPGNLEKNPRYLNDLSQLLYNVVCRSRGCLFCKKKKQREKVFLPVDFLCCRFCTNTLLFGACCNFGVVTGCDSRRASTCHVKKQKLKKKTCLHVQKCLYFLRKSAFPLNDSTWNKSDHLTLGIGI